MHITAFENAGNIYSYRVKKDDVDFDLVASGITRVDIVTKGQRLSTETGEIVLSGSIISVEWGAFNNLERDFIPTWYAYRGPGDKKGEVIFGECLNGVRVKLIPDERP